MILLTVNPLMQSHPGVEAASDRLAYPLAETAQECELREIVHELLEMTLDIVGIVDPTPASDAASLLMALSQGRWFDAALSGAGMIPYVGDLAKTGKLPRWLRTIERALSACQRSEKVAAALRPALARIEQVLSWIPSGNNHWLAVMKQRVRGALPRAGKRVRPRELPDISRRFVFHEPVTNGRFTRRVAEGRLGVPGRVKRHRRRSAQARVNDAFPGDDAGHFFGDRFGAPGDHRNLGAQNWGVNQRSYKRMEDGWADKLIKGYGIDVRVVDVTRAGESRPFMRRVEWIEIAPSGKRTRRQRLFSNPDSVKSRTARGVKNRYPEGHEAEVIDLSDYRNHQ